jgi:hypothetical protein
MAIAREEAWAQRQMMSAQMQMMNAIFMAMLNKNSGDSSNPPPSPSNNKEILLGLLRPSLSIILMLSL